MFTTAFDLVVADAAQNLWRAYADNGAATVGSDFDRVHGRLYMASSEDRA
jgi:hypothetical protein